MKSLDLKVLTLILALIFQIVSADPRSQPKATITLVTGLWNRLDLAAATFENQLSNLELLLQGGGNVILFGDNSVKSKITNLL
jgi:hypothetical protein